MFCSTLVGVAYPVYATLIACSSASSEKHKRWLSYWLIFGCIILLERIGSVFIGYMPFYVLSKTAFLIWCFHQTATGEQGSVFLFDNVLRPLFVEKLGVLDRYNRVFTYVTQAADGEGSSEAKHIYSLCLNVKTVSLSKEASVFCQVRYIPSDAKSIDSGVEFKKHKSQIVQGSEVDLDFRVKFRSKINLF